LGRFPVLMYHRLESDACPVSDRAEARWAVTAAEFARQMDRLRELGRKGVSMADVHRRLAAGEAVPADWVAITFDDGNRSDHVHALPILAERGFRATFFLCGRRLGEGAELSAGAVRALAGAGMHVGSHAMTHRFLTTLAPEDEEEEVRASRRLLESIVGEAVDHFAPPGGRWSARTARALRAAGYTAVSTSRYGFNDAGSIRFAYRRLPVVRSTDRSRFDAMVRAERWRLGGAYLRAECLGLARHVLGESGYGRARRIAAGG